MIDHFYQRLAKFFPDLSLKLDQAESRKTPPEFTKQCFTTAILMSVGFSVGLIFFILILEKSVFWLIPIALVSAVLFFINLIHSLDGKIAKLRKGIDKEILFVGTFMVAELDAGVPIYNVLINIQENYPGVKKYMRQIINDIDYGTGIDEAISKAIIRNPSAYFQKVMYQVANSLKTGSDISSSLGVVLNQINRRQIIEVEVYSRKLNPIALFYLMVAVIFPSLGMVMFVIVGSFIGFKIGMPIFLGITFFLFLIQVLFVFIIESARPAVEM